MEDNLGDIENRPAASFRPAVSVPMPVLAQDGEVFVGPGGKKDAQKIGLGLSKLSSKRKDDIQMARKYAMDISIKQILLRQQKQQQENQQKQQMYAQALSIMSRIYVGSISFEIREDMLRKAFDPFGPIKSINMSWDPSTGHHKTFAFVEYEIPEAALLAQESMNGQMLGGRNLKVNSMMFQEMRLPQNMPQAQPIIDMVQKDAKKYFRVYVASVHPDLSESELAGVFEAFGQIVKCQLARTPTGRGHRGFGYIEFNNVNSQNEAIAGMNMFDLGGQYLRVGKCVTPPDALSYLQPAAVSAIPASVSVACAAITAKVMAAEAAAAGSSPKPGSDTGSRAASPAPQSSTPGTPSSTLPNEIETKAVLQSPKLEQKDGDSGDLSMADAAAKSVKDEPMQIDEDEEVQEEKPKPVPMATAVPAPTPSIVASPGLLVAPTVGVVVPMPSFAPKVEQNFATQEEDTTAEDSAPTGRVKLSTSQRKKLKRDKLNQMTFEEKMSQVLNQQKAVQNQRMEDPVTFGALDEHVAWKDPTNEEQTAEDGKMLAIMGPGRGGDNVASMALALMDGGSSLMLANSAKAKEAAAGLSVEIKKKKKQKEGKKIQPKLNTAQALAAAAKAGEMSDALKNEVMNSEDASLASQEGLEIRGNDARHLLMTKLMRTNRSSVLVLRNMVTPDDIDEFLEGEIREECGKFGNVLDVVIANFASSGIVKIFVKYADSLQVDQAKEALDGRFFGGNTVKAEAYDQILFDHADYTG
uniref:Poly(U)-binding-splicing factor PUF60 n=1 Tax=Caenorhabditis tropicalis TaxID=1561998 RepID=A0A1I7TKF1_9PELO